MVVIEVAMLVASMFLLFILGATNAYLAGFVTNLVAILLEAVPFVLLGSLISGLLEVFVPSWVFQKLLPKRRYLRVMACGLLGIVFPICECGVIPIVRRLVRKGVPPGCAVTYMLAAPIVNPVVAASTLLAFRGDILIVSTRVVLGFVVATAIGLFFTYVLEPRHAVIKEVDSTTESHDHGPDACCHEHDQHEDHGHAHAHGDAGRPEFRVRVTGALRHAGADFFSMSRYLILGSILAALIQSSVRREALQAVGEGRFSGPLVMAALAIALSLCSEADAFVASSFTQFSIASRMSFLVLGPMFDIKLLLMYFDFFKKRAILCLALLTVVLVLLVTIALPPGFAEAPTSAPGERFEESQPTSAQPAGDGAAPVESLVSPLDVSRSQWKGPTHGAG